MARLKILVVEDDVDLRRGLSIRLHQAGYQVVGAGDGLSAVSMARQEHPDLILLDIGLPVGDGFSVLDRLGKLAPLCGTPVVVLTGRDPATTEPAVRLYGVAGFLQKPADNDVLLSTIAGALDEEDEDRTRTEAK